MRTFLSSTRQTHFLKTRADSGITEETMGLFGKIVKTAVNVATLPVAVAKDVVTLGGVSTDQKQPYTAQKLQQIKDDAE
jgi:hypothetical protein